MQITDLNQLDLTKTYSYADYFSWKFHEKVELLKGKIMKMSPAPNRQHQEIAQIINLKIAQFLIGKPCKIYFAPFDVRLERTQNDKLVQNVVQPDICVICDLTKLDDRGCSGAPELIIEILSPGNSSKEMKYKFELYEAAGVEEYWIVDPSEKVIWQYVLEKGQFVNHKPLIEEDRLYSTVLEGFSIELVEVFKS